MSFPIEFIKSSGNYDFISPVINLAGNAAVVTVGGIALETIAVVALLALGIGGEIAGTIALAIPVTVAAFGALVGVAAFGGLIYVAVEFSKVRLWR